TRRKPGSHRSETSLWRKLVAVRREGSYLDFCGFVQSSHGDHVACELVIERTRRVEIQDLTPGRNDWHEVIADVNEHLLRHHRGLPPRIVRREGETLNGPVGEREVKHRIDRRRSIRGHRT